MPLTPSDVKRIAHLARIEITETESGQTLAQLADVGVRGLDAFWAIELVRSQETREMLVPYNASGADAKPMQELLAACKERGVWPFIHFNRLHVTPPITTALADLETGLERIDDALTVVDHYATA